MSKTNTFKKSGVILMKEVEKIRSLLEKLNLEEDVIKEKLVDITFKKKYANLLSLDETSGLLKEELDLKKPYGVSKMYQLIQNGFLDSILNSKKEGYLIEEESVRKYIDFKKMSKKELFELFKMRKELETLLRNEQEEKEEKIIYEDTQYEETNERYEYLKVTKKNDFFKVNSKSGSYTRHSSLDFNGESVAWAFEISTKRKTEDLKNVSYFKESLQEKCEQLELVVSHLDESKYLQILDSIFEIMMILHELTTYSKEKLKKDLEKEKEEFYLSLNNLLLKDVDLFIPNSWQTLLRSELSDVEELNKQNIQQKMYLLSEKVTDDYYNETGDNVVSSIEFLVDYFDKNIAMSDKQKELIEEQRYSLEEKQIKEEDEIGNVKTTSIFNVYEFHFEDENVPVFSMKLGVSLRSREKIVYSIK